MIRGSWREKHPPLIVGVILLLPWYLANLPLYNFWQDQYQFNTRPFFTSWFYNSRAGQSSVLLTLTLASVTNCWNTHYHPASVLLSIYWSLGAHNTVLSVGDQLLRPSVFTPWTHIDTEEQRRSIEVLEQVEPKAWAYSNRRSTEHHSAAIAASQTAGIALYNTHLL